MTAALEQVRGRWLIERPKYEALCKRVEKEIRSRCQSRGLNCHITSRTKETDSLIKKVLRKQYGDPYQEMHDKAGVRVVCTYRDSLESLSNIIYELFEVCAFEDKTSSLEIDQFGYSGIHFEICLRSEDIEGTDDHDLSGLLCEVQLQTRAQSLWADISHELAYKPSQEPPKEVKRMIHLQGALVELFDNQVAEARRKMSNLPGFPELQMLDALDRHYYRLTIKEYDRQLSLHILENLRQLLPEGGLEAFAASLDTFMESKKDTIDVVFADYARDDSVTPLLFQPESLFVFMCMEDDIYSLKEIWGQFLPLEFLQELADIWGTDIGTIE